MYKKEEVLKKPSGLGNTNKDTKQIRTLPLNIAWGIWLARNLKLFEG
jgi:hypothetical protein